tara:strand:- start:665 stop:886 length:222 start_codon:yes stop_codon:yes gene_type:complete
MDTSTACGICFKKGIKVYPVKVGGTWRVEVKEEGQKAIRYKKPLKEGTDTGKALEATYIFLAKKIIKKQNDSI